MRLIADRHLTRHHDYSQLCSGSARASPWRKCQCADLTANRPDLNHQIKSNAGNAPRHLGWRADDCIGNPGTALVDWWLDYHRFAAASTFRTYKPGRHARKRNAGGNSHIPRASSDRIAHIVGLEHDLAFVRGDRCSEHLIKSTSLQRSPRTKARSCSRPTMCAIRRSCRVSAGDMAIPPAFRLRAASRLVRPEGRGPFANR